VSPDLALNRIGTVLNAFLAESLDGPLSATRQSVIEHSDSKVNTNMNGEIGGRSICAAATNESE